MVIRQLKKQEWFSDTVHPTHGHILPRWWNEDNSVLACKTVPKSEMLVFSDQHNHTLDSTEICLH